MTRRASARVEGTVQGVGFRPYVYRLAREEGLAGYVLNDERGVLLDVEGAADAVARFVARLAAEAPPLAAIESVAWTPLPPTGDREFRILDSPAGGEPAAPVTADAATCDDCLAELFDPADRRFRYPFVNCTNCGPRFTIVRRRALRPPADDDGRLRHVRALPGGVRRPGATAASTRSPTPARTAGRRCGWATPSATTRWSRPRRCCSTARSSRSRAWAATTSPAAPTTRRRWPGCARASTARTGRSRSWRPTSRRPRTLVELGETETALLCGRRRPIVLAARRADAPVAAAVAPRSAELGVMLPYSPLHHLLAADTATTLVMTSGNVSDEPIAYRDDDAIERLAGIADHVLVHDRPIRTRTDDSVVRAVGGRPLLLRRSRGHVPEALALPVAAGELLACGAELKSTFCVAKGTARVAGPPHRRPAQRGDPALLRRGRGPLRAALRGHAAGRGPRPAPRLPVDDLRARPRRRRPRGRAAPPRPPGGGAGRARRARAGDRGDLRRHRLRPRRHRVGRRAAGRRPRRLRARRPSVARAPARRRPRRAPAVADGLRMAGRGPGRRALAAAGDRAAHLARGGRARHARDSPRR